jgi:8-oxo-dGTP pyrophosphatase MutT (NUDIX family)
MDLAIVRSWVSQFDPGPADRARRSRDATLRLLETVRQPFSRTTFDPGHVTASGIVLAPAGDRSLLVFHARLGRWLQPGGHVEPQDRDLAETARREVLEETGIRVDERVAPALVGIDVHEIPAARGEPPHLHHDLAFRLLATDPDQPASAGALRAAWCPVARLANWGADEPLRLAVERARSLAPVSAGRDGLRA